MARMCWGKAPLVMHGITELIQSMNAWFGSEANDNSGMASLCTMTNGNFLNLFLV